MKFLTKLIFSTMMLAFLSCSPATLKTESRESADTETSTDPYSWVTWDTCSHNIGDNPCNFTLLNSKGKQVDLYQHYGKVIVIDFSTMWCGVCQNIATKGDEWVSDHGSDKFIWLTVLIEDASGSTVEQSDLQTWVNNYGIQVPVLAGNRDMIDVTDPLDDGYPITGWPTLVVIDQKMVLQYGINGWNESVVDNWIQILL